MTTLAEFLEKQATQERAEAPERERKRAEWLAAVERLLQQMETWLREADKEKILHIERTSVERSEAGLGIYAAPAMVIQLGTRRLEIVTGGLNTFGSVNRSDNRQPARVQGSVDIIEGGTKDTIYRLPGAGDPEWFLVDRSDYLARPLDRAEFERIMLRRLR